MDPRSVDAIILTLGALHRGALTSTQLRDAGLSRKQIAGREGRLLTRVATGIYVVGPVSRESLMSAALAVVNKGALSHVTAARLHGLHEVGWRSNPDNEIEVLSEARTARQIDGVRFRSSRSLPSEDVVAVDGRRVTSVPRTICDLAPLMRGRRLQHVVETALVAGNCTAAEFLACVLSYCRRGRTGSTLLRRVALPLLATEPVATSQLEHMAIELLRAEGLDGWVAQFVPPWHDGVRGTVDLAWPDQRVVLEVDGRRWHSVTQALENDRRRDQAALAAGWWPIRAGWQQVVERPAELAATIRAALER